MLVFSQPYLRKSASIRGCPLSFASIRGLDLRSFVALFVSIRGLNYRLQSVGLSIPY
jgi:hypothetical protein